MKQSKKLGDLRSLGYSSKDVKTELRDNLIHSKKTGVNVFQALEGYDDTVIPELERAILARHNINLLGLRGSSKNYYCQNACKAPGRVYSCN